MDINARTQQLLGQAHMRNNQFKEALALFHNLNDKDGLVELSQRCLKAEGPKFYENTEIAEQAARAAGRTDLLSVVAERYLRNPHSLNMVKGVTCWLDAHADAPDQSHLIMLLKGMIFGDENGAPHGLGEAMQLLFQRREEFQDAIQAIGVHAVETCNQRHWALSTRYGSSYWTYLGMRDLAIVCHKHADTNHAFDISSLGKQTVIEYQYHLEKNSRSDESMEEFIYRGKTLRAEIEVLVRTCRQMRQPDPLLKHADWIINNGSYLPMSYKGCVDSRMDILDCLEAAIIIVGEKSRMANEIRQKCKSYGDRLNATTCDQNIIGERAVVLRAYVLAGDQEALIETGGRILAKVNAKDALPFFEAAAKVEALKAGAIDVI